MSGTTRTARTCAALRKATVLLVGATVVTGAAADPAAEDLARAVEMALGGRAFERVGYLAFTFRVEREGKALIDFSHRWDRRRGRYRLAGTEPGGARLVVTFDTATRQGTALRDGRPLEGEEAARALDRAYRRFINDTYWLLMPFKLRDRGVVLREDAARPLPDGRVARVLHLSFLPGTGLTSGDEYWVWIDPETHRVDRWEYALEGWQDRTRTAVWTGWVERSGVWLSTEKVFPDDHRVIRFSGVTLAEECPPGAFDVHQAALGDEPGGAS